ncbi:MAG: endonuclease/exonuclease/phosphatase family protein [Fidelibacterota bacterium]
MRRYFLFTLILLIGCQSAPESFTLTLMSYNVRHGVSMHWKPAIKDQAAIINAQSPDWVGLQEIDHLCRRSNTIDQTSEFGDLTGMRGFFGKFMDFDSGRYGMAVLSNLPVVKTKILELPEGAEPRVAIIQTVKLNKKLKLALANVHFDWTTSDYRISQAQTLISYLDKLQLPTIVLGDYNAKPGSPTLKLFMDSGFQPVKKKENQLTWPAENPTVEIDHFFIRGTRKINISPEFIKVLNEPEASDHLPVVARLKILRK